MCQLATVPVQRPRVSRPLGRKLNNDSVGEFRRNLTACALNLVRAVEWLTTTPPGKRRPSRFAALKPVIA